MSEVMGKSRVCMNSIDRAAWSDDVQTVRVTS